MGERLAKLYEELADLIPEALAEDFTGSGYARGKYYDEEAVRILVVEKIPRAEREDGCKSGLPHGLHGQESGDEKDFSGVIARLSRELLHGASDWQNRVAWTWLYKLAPKDGKPDETIYAKQKELCEEIIREEIAALKPTLVLFLTGWGGIWDFGLPISPVLKGEAVEGWGRTEEGVNLIVTRYAVRKPEDKFALDILEKIRLIEELETEEERV